MLLTETKNYLILDKPSGLLAHPTAKNEKETVVSWILKKYPEVAEVGDNTDVRPGIVHRLDKDVSGVMLVARTQEFFDYIKNQFQDRKIEKKYTALVHGVVEPDLGKIDFSIARSKTRVKKGKMVARPKSQEGKDAITFFEVEKRFVNHSLVLAKPKTGRTHQIRVHLFAFNHPIVGDKIYYNKKFGRDKIEKMSNRIFLHASELGFVDMEGEKQKFSSDLPNDLKNILEKL